MSNRTPGDIDPASVTTDSLVIGGKIYELDGTIDETSASITYSVNGSYREIVLLAGDATGQDRLQVNGDTGGNYDSESRDGTDQSGQTAWTVPRGSARPVLHIKAQGTARHRMGMVETAVGNPIVGGRNDNVGGDITQFTLFDSGSTQRDTKLDVYGRSI